MADSTLPSEEDKAAIARAKRREHGRRYYQKNKAKIAEYWRSPHAKELRKKFRERNREKRNAKNREYMRADREKDPQKHRDRALACQRKNPEAHRRRSARYYEKHKDRAQAACNRYQKRRRAEDPIHALCLRMRGRLRKALSAKTASKVASTIELVGCSPENLARHIESQFLPGMSWKNRSEWHIDHIIPVSKFDLSDADQQRSAFHYTNLQPLWAADNRRKSDKVQGQQLFGFAYADKIASVMNRGKKTGRPKDASRKHCGSKHC